MTKKIWIDCEVYKDYFLLSALSNSDNTLDFEMYDGHPLDTRKLSALMHNYLSIGFNSLNYDLLIIRAAIMGFDNNQLKELSDVIIKSNKPSWLIAKSCGIKIPKTWDHIDLIELPIGRSSLKIYGGRLNAHTIQDLPIEPDQSITPDLREPMRQYCHNDLYTTKLLHDNLVNQIDLRVKMSEQYGMDLRSKSDAQIAETVIKSELNKLTGIEYRKPEQTEDLKFRYINPKIISFEDVNMQAVFKRILQTDFETGGNGSVILPAWLKEKINFYGRDYQMGIGGLHSCEKSQYVAPNQNQLLFDLDVASYYPNIILQQQLAPKSMGAPFLKVYKSIVDRRIKAKRDGDKVTADTLKICVNGSFGKLGSKYSPLYAPDLLIQTTLTGQLALLMLIEHVTLAGGDVKSANTDGVVILSEKEKVSDVLTAAFDWELTTSYELERTDYKALASRDVNNYLAVTTDNKIKGKGVFSKTGLSKNPDCKIVFDAVAKYISSGDKLDKTIFECDDITKFVMLRRVNGGAIWCDEKLGKAVRYYHSSDLSIMNECIKYEKNSNKVPKSLGCRPVMTLPEKFPEDINYHVYINQAKNLLKEVGL